MALNCALISALSGLLISPANSDLEPSDKPTVVLITVDALRADRLGAYGYAGQTSPRLDALAEKSILFERAYAPIPSTPFSIASLMTGRHAYGIAQEADLAGQETLADRFAAKGYATIALYPPAVYFAATKRLDDMHARHFGFSKVIHNALPEDRDAVERTNEALRLLNEHRDRPVFLWTHYFAPHEPYVTHAEISRLDNPTPSESERYDDEIRWVDGEIGRLLDYLQAERPQSIVVITADHGEEFGEHGGAYHGTSLFEEQIRVPFMIHAPDLPPRRETLPVSTVDLPRIVERALGLRANEPWRRDVPVFAELSALKAVMVGQHKAICDLWKNRCRLFDLANDPREQRDLSLRQPRTMQRLRQLLDGWVAANPALPYPGLTSSMVEGTLRRARRGDRSTAPTLLFIVGDHRLDIPTRAQAARLLSSSAQREQQRGLRRVWTARDTIIDRWLAIALARIGERRARQWLTRADPVGCHQDDVEFCAHRAIVLARPSDSRAASRIAEALQRADNDGLRCQMFAALGQNGGPTAREILTASYEEIRTRHCVARALARLRDPDTAEFIAGKIPTEPYANVRAVLVRALGRAGGNSYRAHLEQIRIHDREPIVSTAAAMALCTLGKSRVPDLRTRGRRSKASRQNRCS